MDTHDPGNYLLTVKGRRVQDGQILFTTDLRLPVQTWVGADLDRLAHIGDDSAEVELWLQKGAPVQELPVEVDLVDARTGQTRSSLSHRRLTRDKTRVPFDLQGLAPATYHVRVRPRIDGRLWDDGVRRSLYLYRNGPPPEPEPPIEIPVAPQLFVDDFLIEDQIHLQRVFHPARKLTAHFTPEIGSEIDLKRYYHEPQTLMGGGAAVRSVESHDGQDRRVCYPVSRSVLQLPGGTHRREGSTNDLE